MQYLYFDDGSTSLARGRIIMAQAHLSTVERLVLRWTHPLTNGHLAHKYGERPFMAARTSRYRCQLCRFADVRALKLEAIHPGGENEDSRYVCLCANCKAIHAKRNHWIMA